MADSKLPPKGPQQINIELPAEVARGVYSNLAVISHSDSEVVMDFIQIFSGTPKAEVRSRVIMTPQNAKRVLFALRENLEKYEMNHGEISLGDINNFNLPPNFGPAGMA